MIFQELHRLYDRLKSESEYGIAPPGRSLQKITFKVVLRPDGTLLSIDDVRDYSARSAIPLQIMVLGATKPSGSGLNPSFLWDNSQYMLGIKAEDPKPERSQAAFQAFRERHLAAEGGIDDVGFNAVCRFLESWDPSAHADHPVLLDAGVSGYGVFQIVGETRYVHEHPSVQSWWDDQPLGDNPVYLQCLVTGDVRPIARTHEKIKGVVGGQGAGGTIAGFNDPAYESYGVSQSFNAPVGEAIAFKYTTALNSLLDGPKKKRHRIMLGDSTVVFWTDRPSVVEDFFTQFASLGSGGLQVNADAQDEGVRSRLVAILDAVRTGRADPSAFHIDLERTGYHILALSPNSARIAVRFYHCGSVEDLIGNLSQHFNDISIARRPPVGRWPGDPEFPSFRELLDQTARERKDVPPHLAAPLLKAVVTRQPYPQALYAAVIRRIAADRRVSYLRGCILKGFLTRNLGMNLTMSLDTTRVDPAYLLGRLFAALEKTQQDALGKGLNKTLRDSYYGSASATPRSVFPRLLRTYQHHLSKLDGGFRVNRERLIQEIMKPLATFPPHLDLAGQGSFAIGYYHQTDDFYRKRVEQTAD